MRGANDRFARYTPSMVSTSKPVATVTVEPTGARATIPRDHTIKVLLKLSAASTRHGDKVHVAALARKVLAGFSPADGKADRRRITEMSLPGRPGKGGVLSGVEGS